MKCKHCGDYFAPDKCDICKMRIYDECMECHKETHGIIGEPPVAPKAVGNTQNRISFWMGDDK